jgi:hypothetical protein
LQLLIIKKAFQWSVTLTHNPCTDKIVNFIFAKLFLTNLQSIIFDLNTEEFRYSLPGIPQNYRQVTIQNYYRTGLHTKFHLKIKEEVELWLAYYNY